MHLNPEALKHHMDDKRWSQVDLAKEIGLPLSTFKGYAKARRAVPRSVVNDISLALGISPALILGPTDFRDQLISVCQQYGIGAADFEAAA